MLFVRLLAIGLELPEEAFHKIHNFDAFGEAMSKSDPWIITNQLVVIPHLLYA